MLRWAVVVSCAYSTAIADPDPPAARVPKTGCLRLGAPAIASTPQDAARRNQAAHDEAVKKLGATPVALASHSYVGPLGKGPTITATVNGVTGTYVVAAAAPVGKFARVGGKLVQLVPTADRTVRTEVVQCGCAPPSCPPVSSGAVRPTMTDHDDKVHLVYGPLPPGTTYGGDLAVRHTVHAVSLGFESICSAPCPQPPKIAP